MRRFLHIAFTGERLDATRMQLARTLRAEQGRAAVTIRIAREVEQDRAVDDGALHDLRAHRL